MKNKRIGSIGILVLLSVLFTLSSCDRMKVGYLNTTNASYNPDTVFAFRNIDPKSERAKNNAPWTSVRIQGVAGTVPINYEYVSVKTAKGGNVQRFNEQVKKGNVLIQGGIIQLFQAGVKEIPNGTYTLTIRVYNEDHSALLKDIFTFVVSDNAPTN